MQCEPRRYTNRVQRSAVGESPAGFEDGSVIVTVRINTFELYTLDVDPLVLNRGSSPEAVGHNALIRDAGYFSTVDSRNLILHDKALARPAVRARFWYREFREIVLKFAISNIEQLCEPL